MDFMDGWEKYLNFKARFQKNLTHYCYLKGLLFYLFFKGLPFALSSSISSSLQPFPYTSRCPPSCNDILLVALRLV